jgi:hypothetical protein
MDLLTERKRRDLTVASLAYLSGLTGGRCYSLERGRGKPMSESEETAILAVFERVDKTANGGAEEFGVARGDDVRVDGDSRGRYQFQELVPATGTAPAYAIVIGGRGGRSAQAGQRNIRCISLNRITTNNGKTHPFTSA